MEGSLVEVKVSALTRVGEGESSSTRVTLTSLIAASIYTNNETVKGRKGQDITLFCHNVGVPKNRVTWSHQGIIIIDSDSSASKTSGRIKLQANGRLLIQDAKRSDSGNYTCRASNTHGSDQLTHLVTIIGEEYFYLV